ncbi:MAG: hypothetical protein RL701_5660 [Pseudomonadota bacterium]|jgi:hypothetical protein
MTVPVNTVLAACRTCWLVFVFVFVFVACRASSVAHAQAEPTERIVVLGGRGVSKQLRDAIAAVVDPFGRVVNRREYEGAVHRAGVPLESATALREVVSRTQASVVIVVVRTQRRFALSYVDGASGATLYTASVRTQGHRLSLDSRVQLVAATNRALTELRNSRRVVVVDRSEAEEEMHSDTSPARAADHGQQSVSPAQSDTELADALEREKSDTLASPVTERSTGAAADDVGTFRAQLGAGVGVAARGVLLPSSVGQRGLSTGLFPALDISLSGQGALTKYWLLGVHARYQTSVFLSSVEVAPGASTHKTSLRAHRLELGVMPGWRFAASADAVSLRVFVGWNWRGLRSVVDTRIPPYTLQGALIRPELRIPVVQRFVFVTLAAEVFWISMLTDELRRVGGTSASGVAFGGQIALDFRLLERLQLSVDYRESRAAISTVWSAAMTDIERFASARLVVCY